MNTQTRLSSNRGYHATKIVHHYLVVFSRRNNPSVRRSRPFRHHQLRWDTRCFQAACHHIICACEAGHPTLLRLRVGGSLCPSQTPQLDPFAALRGDQGSLFVGCRDLCGRHAATARETLKMGQMLLRILSAGSGRLSHPALAVGRAGFCHMTARSQCGSPFRGDRRSPGSPGPRLR